jgi:dienelactone hydrolase
MKTRLWLVTGGFLLIVANGFTQGTAAAEENEAGSQPSSALAAYFQPPEEFAGDLGDSRSPLEFADGRVATTPETWQGRRQEILDHWHGVMGPWPMLLARPAWEVVSSERREDFTQQKIRVEVDKDRLLEGWYLVPDFPGRRPAVLVVYYEPETSIGLQGDNRDFAYQLTKRGFITLSIGSPPIDARRPDTGAAACQPLSYLGFVAANCHTALAQQPRVDPARIGVVGHSYGGKWALFAACLHDKFACVAVSDPGIVWDESRPNVNYWEPWYLGRDANVARTPGVPSPDNPRTGAYKTLYESGHDLVELHALLAPRPILVSGGSEDPPQRWRALNHLRQVNQLLGQENRVAMTNRPGHDPTEDSNAVLYQFFGYALGSLDNY